MTQGLYRSTVEDKVHKMASQYGGDPHEAFLRLIFYLVTGFGYADLEPEDIIDGHGEYQIDALHIDTSRREDYATVTLIQVTFSDSLSSTKLIKMHAGLDYLLQQPKAIYSKLSNPALRDRIQEFRDLRSEILPSSIRLQCYYAALGDPSKASGEFPEQVTRIQSDYGDSVGEFSFQVLGPSQIFELLNQRERHGTKANDKLRIIYDQNKANLLEHSVEDVSGVICTVTAEEIARVVNTHPSVFDDNLRRFLGFGGSVNSAIKNSSTSPTDAPLFWFLNNGVTIVCDGYEVHKDFDDPFVEIEGIRIVNGCQTSTTLAKAQNDHVLQPSTKVMVRILKTKSENLASRLLITTNTQNKITSRDLHAQDKIQEHIQQEFERRFELRYERMANEFAANVQPSDPPIISNQKIGQAYLAVVRRRPSDARRRQYKIWEQSDYQHIFNESVFPETHLLVYRIAEFCASRKRAVLPSVEQTDIRRTILANGVYHLARAVAFLWRRSDDWSDLEQVRRELQKMQDEPEMLGQYFDNALNLLVDIFNKNEEFLQDPTTTLKSGRLEEEIDKALYSRIGQQRKRRLKPSPRAKSVP